MQTLNLKKVRCERKLKRMVFQYGQAKTLYQTCVRLKVEFTNEGSKEYRAIRYWEQLSLERLRETGYLAQKRLHLKIEDLKQGLEWLSSLCI